MGKTYLIPGYGYLSETGPNTFLIPGYGYVGEGVASIDNEEDYLLTVQYEGITVYPDGTNWWVGS